MVRFFFFFKPCLFLGSQRLAGGYGIPCVPEALWELLTTMVITAPEWNERLVMYGYGPGVLPRLSHLELSNPGQQGWSLRRLTVTTVVIHAMMGMSGDFQGLLKAVPNLSLLKLYADAAPDHLVARDMRNVTARVRMDRLERVLIGDSHCMSLDLFSAPALRHFSYHIKHSCDLDSQYARFVMDLVESRRFIFDCNAESLLETLVINIPLFPINHEWVEVLVQGLDALTAMVLCMGGEEPYRNLQNQPLPALKKATFWISNAASVRHVDNFAQSHTRLQTVKIMWVADPESEFCLDRGTTLEVMKQFGLLSSQGHTWTEDGPGCYRFKRQRSL